MKKLLLFIAMILMIFGCGEEKKQGQQTPQEQTTQQAETPAPPKEGSNRYSPVVTAVKNIENSVVNIRTEKLVRTSVGPFGQETPHGENYLNDFFGYDRTYKTQSLGSGFIVRTDGTIITNYHVIESATKIYVITTDNKSYEARLVGGDKILDIAVLKIITAGKFPAVKIGNSDGAMLGETVIAMGNPYGLNSSITTGVVSSVKRILNIGNGYSLYIQTDALINPGNSGGPLINLDGEVIGINSAVVQEAQGIGFSIPINTAVRVLPEILKSGKVTAGYMGFSAKEVKDKNSISLIVTRVEKGSNAEGIGMRSGDRILQVNGLPVSSILAMSNMLRSYPPGSAVQVVVERGAKTFKGQILLTTYPDNYGLSVLRNIYGLTFTQKEDYLTVASTGIADTVHEGDVLVAINDTEIKDINHLNSYIMDNMGTETVMTLYRYGQLFRVKFQL
ncbi:trypsin-like peptidase domain-containing protein [Seleniivibrio sp.]|uniref:S1C family serine protease n=1 Tax=Seleniivibrio sp. TaxID=2898801 RepID=UPI0026008D04|nr:trypsin-like peptidase domain-containing protein [Seleniivibrio sp.]MCD8554230.1 trypsin-like peptidase domain-containing protein [Seleniivibrio sp.]